MNQITFSVQNLYHKGLQCTGFLAWQWTSHITLYSIYAFVTEFLQNLSNQFWAALRTLANVSIVKDII